MSQKIYAALVVLFICGFSIWVFWEDGEAGSIPPRDEPSPTTSVPTSPAVAAADLDSGPVSAPNPTRLEVADPSASGPGKLEPAYQGEDRVTIKVVDSATGLSVPEADIYLLLISEDNGAQVMEVMWDGPFAMHAILRELGLHFRTNQEGTVTVPPMTGYLFALAESGTSFFSEGELSLTSGEVVFELRPNRIFTVSVLDSFGERASGIPVELQTGTESRRSRQALSYTNDSGIATFADFDQEMEDMQNSGAVYVSLAFPIDPNIVHNNFRVELTDSIIAQGTTSLNLPPTGRIKIKILGLKGDPYLEFGFLEVHAIDSNGERRPTSLRRLTFDGSAEFEHVGLGLRLEAAFGDGGLGDELKLIFDGPTVAGERTEVSIIREPHTKLVGFLLRPDGQPLANQSLRITDELQTEIEDESIGFHYSAYTEEDGSFQVDVKIPDLEAAKIVGRRLTLMAEVEAVGYCRKEIEIPTVISSGSLDLGVQTLTQTPILLAGHVFDQQGNPIPDAYPSLEKLEYSARFDFDFWRRTDVRVQRADEHGAFEIQGTIPVNETYQLQVSASGFQTFTQEIALGPKDLVIRLTKAGKISGIVRIDEAIDPIFLQINFAGGGDRHSVRLEPTEDATTWKIGLDGDLNTPYSLTFSTQQDEVLLQLEDLIFEPDSETRPPALQPLDLRGRLHTATIRARNSEGELLSASIRAGESRIFNMLPKWTGEAVFVFCNPVKEIQVMHRGYIPEVLHQVSSDQTVVLQKAVKVRVKIPAKYLSYREASLQVNAGPTASDLDSDFIQFDQSGTAEMYFPEYGNFPIQLSIRPTNGSAWDSVELPTRDYQITMEGQTIELSLDLEELDQKIDTLFKQE
jgi:hypothetical protein